jgi:hypothetical protein
MSLMIASQSARGLPIDLSGMASSRPLLFPQRDVPSDPFLVDSRQEVQHRATHRPNG